MTKWDPYRDPPLPMKLFFTLYRVHAGLVRRLEEQLAPLDLSIGRLCLLVALRRREEPALPSELGDDLAVTRANVSGLLAGLERAGLVERRLHPQDRRRTLVSLTRQGTERLAEAWPIYQAAVSAELEGLDPAEQQLLLRLLTRLG